MAKVVVAYPKFDQVDYDWIQSIRKESDILYYNVIDPHFTIVFPVFTEIDEKIFVKHVEEKSTEFKQFDFVLSKAIFNKDAFNDYWHVFLVPDEGSNDIVLFHDKLYQGLLKSELRLDIPFIAHIGIANNLNRLKMGKLADKINARSVKIKGKIDSLDICRYDDKITTIKKIRLNKNKE